MRKNSRVLAIGDTHKPAHHRDALDFIDALVRKYKPDRTIHIGDEADFGACSYHERDSDLPSAGDEYRSARKYLHQLQDIVPAMELLISNHGSLPFRKARTAGIPGFFLKPYDAIWGTKRWSWHHKINLTTPDGVEWEFAHGEGGGALQRMGNYGVSTVHGHQHTKFYAVGAQTPRGMRYACHTGCLIDADHLAMVYGKTNIMRPALGSLMIIDGTPILHPLKLNSRGRWTGKL